MGGLVLRARNGPVRDAFLALVQEMPMPQTRIAPTIADDQLFGGVDIAGTLTAGRVIASEGLLARPLALVVAMAERD